jgi:Sulfotransferase domain
MLVVCDGMPRSASTWSFNVVLALLRNSQPVCEVYSGYDENIAGFLRSAPATATHVVVKCHEPGAHLRALAQSDVARVIYTWRDPADVVVSCMRMFDYDFEHSLASVASSLELYKFHRRWQNALILDYGQIVSESTVAVKQIATYLNLDDDAESVARISEQTSLEHVKKDVESMAGGTRLVRRSGFEYDPDTLLHPSHIRDGSQGYGRAILTAEQLKQVDALLGDSGPL